MNLREYLLIEKMSGRDFATKAGISPETLSRILSGSQKPSKQMLSHLEKMTDNHVKAENIMGPGTLSKELKDQEKE